MNYDQDRYTLHPISERSERQSDMIGNAMNSLIKSKGLTMRSQIGRATTGSLPTNRLFNMGSFGTETHKSQANSSMIADEKEEDLKIEQKAA